MVVSLSLLDQLLALITVLALNPIGLRWSAMADQLSIKQAVVQAVGEHTTDRSEEK